MRHLLHNDNGSVTAFLTIFVVGLLVLAGLALDGGLALAASVRANGQAEAAARAAAQELDLGAYRNNGFVRLDNHAATTAAHDYLDAAGVTGAVHVSDDTVTVTITGAEPTQMLRLIGISAIHYRGSATARPHMGDD